MKLKDYLKDKNMSASDFAFLCKFSFPVVYRVLREQDITAKYAKKIYKKTKGEVNYEHIYVSKGSK